MRSQGAEMFGCADIFIIIQSQLYETSKSTLNSLSLSVFSFPLPEMLCSSASIFQMSKQTEV